MTNVLIVINILLLATLIKGAPEGCTNEPSRVHPTPEQKAKFKEFVERIQGVGQQFAIKTVEG